MRTQTILVAALLLASLAACAKPAEPMVEPIVADAPAPGVYK